MCNATRKGALLGSLLVLCSPWWLACSDKAGPTTSSPAPEAAGAASGGANATQAGGEAEAEVTGHPSEAEPAIALADSPDVDLVDNRFLWHLAPPAQASGLFVPVASEGLRKYTQQYRNPWGDVVTRDGHSGRVLQASSAELRIPWRPAAEARGPVRLRARLHGLSAGQRLSVSINGERVVNASLDDGWQDAAFEIKRGALRAGENQVVLFFGKRGGPERAYALVHSLAFEEAAASDSAGDDSGGGDGGDSASWPPLSPAAQVRVADTARPALTGFTRMSAYLEVPETGWLELHTGAPGAGTRFRVTAQPVEGAVVEILDHTSEDAGWRRHRRDLAELAGKLVILEFALSGEGAEQAAWGEPRLALAEAPTRAAPPPYDNAILLVVDALRSDRLRLYGDTRVKTPHISADGNARGVVFLHNQAASPSSPPSHGSIQTGMIPRVHGVTGDNGKLEPGTPMISTQAEAAGIAAGYYGNNPFGMGRLEAPGEWTAFHQPNKEGKGIDCTVLMDEMLGFAKQQADAGKRFFISSLPYETHTPYRYHEGITDNYHDGDWGPPVGKNVDGVLLSKLSSASVTLNDAQWAQLRALYDGEAEYMDGCYQQLLDGLEARGLRERTLLVLTSDHGEGMYEHGRMGHAFGHYAELANVPLVFLGDGLTPQGAVLDAVSSHLDIAPTILALLGVTPSERIQGRDLRAQMLREGPWTPRVVSLEYGRSYALRARRWKYIVDYQQNESLFDLVEDPSEQRDLLGTQDIPLRYLRDLAGVFLAHRKAWRADSFGELNNHAPGFLRHVAAPVFD